MVVWILIKNGSILENKDFIRLDNPNDDFNQESQYLANVILYFSVKYHLPMGEWRIGGYGVTHGSDTYEIKVHP